MDLYTTQPAIGDRAHHSVVSLTLTSVPSTYTLTISASYPVARKFLSASRLRFPKILARLPADQQVRVFSRPVKTLVLSSSTPSTGVPSLPTPFTITMSTMGNDGRHHHVLDHRPLAYPFIYTYIYILYIYFLNSFDS